MQSYVMVGIVGLATACTFSLADAGSRGLESHTRLVTNQSQQSDPSMSDAEQARRSQEQPSHSQFGGQPKDQAARERHHPQYPESAQHLGPQETEPSQAETRSSQQPPRGQDQKKKDAVSGVGH